MATKNPVIADVLKDGGSVTQFRWTVADGNQLLNTDDGAPIDFSQWADRSVTVQGTFGAGGNLRIEGSNDGGATYQTLNDPAGAALDITGAKVKAVLEITQKLRPRVTAGDGTTSLEVCIIVRRAQQLRV